MTADSSMMKWCTQCLKYQDTASSHLVAGSRSQHPRSVCNRCYTNMITDNGGGTYNHDNPDNVHFVHIYTTPTS